MAKHKFIPNYICAIVVVHGESENIITKHIKSSLRLNVYIHRRSTSIQINGLLNELNTNFGDIKQLKSKLKNQLDIDKNKVKNFKIFTIMDTDDCTDKMKKQYINGDLFSSYNLKEYVVPIYSNPDLENALYLSGLIPKIFNDSEKVKEYGKLFPINRVAVGNSQLPLEEMKKTYSKLESNGATNLELFIKYCIEQAERNRTKRSF